MWTRALETEKVYVHIWKKPSVLQFLYSDLGLDLDSGHFLVGLGGCFQFHSLSQLGEEGLCIGLCGSESRTSEENLGDGREEDLVVCVLRGGTPSSAGEEAPGSWLRVGHGTVSQSVTVTDSKEYILHLTQHETIFILTTRVALYRVSISLKKSAGL